MSSRTGIVYKSTGSWYLLRDEDGEWWQGRTKGKLRIDDEISSTNPIAVGDAVSFQEEDETAKTATISGIADRNNYMVRVSPHNRNQKHIVAANLDLALVIVTIASPRTSQGFIDRFLATAEAYHIPALIVVNKTDLLRPKDLKQLEAWEAMYGAAGYTILRTTTAQPETIDALKVMLEAKRTLFSGHSGVGKSTIINHLIPDLSIRTGEVSNWSGKGQHTTTFAEMHELPDGGQIIDTPGVKEFGLIDFEPEELSHYFPELRHLMPGCRFHNCMHLNEPGCAVKAALEAGSLSALRYESYVAMLDTLETQRYR